MERYRGEDAGDLKRSELNVFVFANWTPLNDLEVKIWKSDQNDVMDEELVQIDVMDEELVQNIAMGENFVKNFVMGAKNDPNMRWICPFSK